MTITKSGFLQKVQDGYKIDPELFFHYNVKRGLRNSDGTGVLAGITKISNVHGYNVIDSEVVPNEGRLELRGYDVMDLLRAVHQDGRFGFEEVAFLLLFGDLPTNDDLKNFLSIIDEARDLPEGFVKSLILRAPSDNIMNMMARSILNLYAFDENAADTSLEHEIYAGISIISRLARIAPLSYHAHIAEKTDKNMVWHAAIDGLSTAETILYMLRPDQEWTTLEAQVLDTMLMIHAEHGGGNNSTFTCRVLSSSGTDAYSAYAGAVCSLKGPKHGGANIRVAEMVTDLKATVADWQDEGQVADYLRKVLKKEAFDRSGLIYGMGHAVYTKSDPRAIICNESAAQLAKGTKWEADVLLMERIEQISRELLFERNKKVSCANVDLYSGLVYHMLDIPEEMYTPLFATSRIAGWEAHRLEELLTCNRIIRPAYKTIATRRKYVHIDER